MYRLLPLLLTIILGVLLRTLPLDIDPFIRKWGGSVLWGAMMTCIVALVRPRAGRTMRCIAAFLLAFFSESLKTFHFNILDAMRRTTLGSFLLGHQFSWYNVVAYSLGILIVIISTPPITRHLCHRDASFRKS